MGSWYDEVKNNYKYLSIKQGADPIRLTVKEIVKTEEGDPKYQFKTKDGRCLGYSYVIKTDTDQELNVNTFSLLDKLVKAKVDSGDTIEISHPGHGQWEVKKI